MTRKMSVQSTHQQKCDFFFNIISEVSSICGCRTYGYRGSTILKSETDVGHYCHIYRNKRILKEYCEQLYANKFYNLDEMRRFLET